MESLILLLGLVLIYFPDPSYAQTPTLHEQQEQSRKADQRLYLRKGLGSIVHDKTLPMEERFEAENARQGLKAEKAYNKAYRKNRKVESLPRQTLSDSEIQQIHDEAKKIPKQEFRGGTLKRVGPHP